MTSNNVVKVEKDLPEDPDNKGWVLGWGVVRSAPWHFVGVYSNKSVAQAEVDLLGESYATRYGSHRLGSDDFISGETTYHSNPAQK